MWLAHALAIISACLAPTCRGDVRRFRRDDSGDPLNPTCTPVDDPYDDLRDQKIYAIIYYGRREYAEILNAYLERDLRKNGGVLDAVLWALVKYTVDDIKYLGELQRRNPDAYVVPRIDAGGWDNVWRLAEEPGAIYMKIDDDIVYIAPGAIAEMAREKLRERFLFVSANVVNHGILSAVHQELVQIRWIEPPFKNNTEAKPGAPEPWRYRSDVILDPNYRIEHTFYSDCIWRRWDCAALAHEAFLHRLADGTSCAFDFGIFDFHAHGYLTMSDGLEGGRSIDWNDNFFAFKTEDFSDIDWEGVANDDEAEMSSKHPQRRNQHAGALGRAVVVHFTFSVQEKGLRNFTDLLDRYREVAMPIMAETAAKHYDGVWQPTVYVKRPES